jgi:hypothetical protein
LICEEAGSRTANLLATRLNEFLRDELLQDPAKKIRALAAMMFKRKDRPKGFRRGQ